MRLTEYQVKELLTRLDFLELFLRESMEEKGFLSQRIKIYQSLVETLKVKQLIEPD